jgi:hypothetical protein
MFVEEIILDFGQTAFDVRAFAFETGLGRWYI